MAKTSEIDLFDLYEEMQDISTEVRIAGALIYSYLLNIHEAGRPGNTADAGTVIEKNLLRISDDLNRIADNILQYDKITVPPRHSDPTDCAADPAAGSAC